MGGKDSPSELRLGDRYQISLRQRLQDMAGCPAYAAQSLGGAGGSCLALAPSTSSPRLPDIVSLRHESLLPLYTFEYHEGALWVICAHTPGPSLAEGLPVWGENQIIDGAVRPLAGVLAALQIAGLTCRAIRLDNVFLAANGQELVLGPLGVSPPAAHQPVVLEPLSSAVCDPLARGTGTVACDVFSLGVMILTLCMGKPPLADLSDHEILARRLRYGSAAAYIGDFRVPEGLHSLILAMLSDDPEQRPSPHDLVTMTSDKLFILKPRMPARVPLTLGGVEIWTPRALAWHATQHPAEFSALLQRQVVAHWLRDEVRQAAMAVGVEQVGGAFLSSDRKGADFASLSLMHVLTVLDPAAPLFWGGRWFWPDALPVMVAHAAGRGSTRGSEERNVLAVASVVVDNPEFFELPSVSGALRQQFVALREVIRKSDARGADRLLRLPYDTNIFQVCLSPLCVEKRISQPGGLLIWLEDSVSAESLTSEQVQKMGILDVDARLFLLSRVVQFRIALSGPDLSGLPLWNADLVLLAAIQKKEAGYPPAMNVAAAVCPLLKNDLRRWRSRSARGKRWAGLEDAVAQGDLRKLLQIVEDPHDLRVDQALAEKAEVEITRLVRDLKQDPGVRMEHDRLARNTGEFISLSAGIGVAIIAVWLEFCQ